MNKNIYAWLLGLGALLFPAFLIEIFGPGEAEAWMPVYWAGAVGGLALELFAGGWGVELPSYSQRRPAEKRWAPLGPWHDLGFLARMTTGAIAAPVFLILINVVGEGVNSSELAALGDDLENLAWGALIGAASPTVWKLAESLTAARIGVVQQQLSGQLTAEGTEAVEQAREKLADPNVSDRDAEASLALAQGKLESARSVLSGGSATSEATG